MSAKASVDCEAGAAWAGLFLPPSAFFHPFMLQQTALAYCKSQGKETSQAWWAGPHASPSFQQKAAVAPALKSVQPLAISTCRNLSRDELHSADSMLRSKVKQTEQTSPAHTQRELSYNIPQSFLLLLYTCSEGPGHAGRCGTVIKTSKILLD